MDININIVIDGEIKKALLEIAGAACELAGKEPLAAPKANAWEELKATASTFVSTAVGLWNNLKAKFNEVVDAIIAKWNSLGDDLPTRIAGAIGLVVGIPRSWPLLLLFMSNARPQKLQPCRRRLTCAYR